MSLFPNSKISVALTPKGVGIVRYAGPWRRRLVEKTDRLTDREGLSEALALVEAYISTVKGKGATIQFVVSAAFVRFAVLPWLSAFVRHEELQTLANARFTECYGDMIGWRIAYDLNSPYGHSMLGYAIPEKLLKSLQEICTRHRVECASIQPFFSESWNRYRNQTSGQEGLYATLEGGRLVVASLKGVGKDRQWQSIRSIMLSGEDIKEKVADSLEREILLQGYGKKPPVWLDTAASRQKGLLSSLDHISLDNQLSEMALLEGKA